MNPHKQITAALLIGFCVCWTVACEKTAIPKVDSKQEAAVGIEPQGKATATVRPRVKPPRDAVSQKTATIQAIFAAPSRYADKPIRLSGVFKGWKGACKGSPPKTRSDWMVEDGTGCIYVHGVVPEGLQPMSPKDEPVVLDSMVRLTAGGLPYLEMTAP